VSGTTWVSWYQKGKTRKVKPIWFTGARDSEWQWYQLGICKSASWPRQITMPASHHSVFYRSDALPAAQTTALKHWRHWHQLGHMQILSDYISHIQINRHTYTWWSSYLQTNVKFAQLSFNWQYWFMTLKQIQTFIILFTSAGKLEPSKVFCRQAIS